MTAIVVEALAAASAYLLIRRLRTNAATTPLVMSSGNVALHPFNSGVAAIVRACPEREQRVEWETSLNISVLTAFPKTEIVRDSSTSVGMTR
jgi:hypothetical protein